MKNGQIKKNSSLRQSIAGANKVKETILTSLDMSENEWSQLFFEAGTHLAEYYEDEFAVNPTFSATFWDWFLMAKARFDADFVKNISDFSIYRKELFIALEESVFRSEYLRYINFDMVEHLKVGVDV